jgi:FlaA1/EpsC-like NDP-sugar epimerase
MNAHTLPTWLHFLTRILDRPAFAESTRAHRVLVYGAGDTAGSLIRELTLDSTAGRQVIGVVDDGPNRKRRFAHNRSVLGNAAEVHEILDWHHVDEVILATEEQDESTLGRLLDSCRSRAIPVRRFSMSLQ